jgi:hypothetical protein
LLPSHGARRTFTALTAVVVTSAQVYKALRGGVQDVAVKVLLATDEEQLLQFEKVEPRNR